MYDWLRLFMTFVKGESFMGNNFSYELQAFLSVNSEAVEPVVINFNICNAHHYVHVSCRYMPTYELPNLVIVFIVLIYVRM